MTGGVETQITLPPELHQFLTELGSIGGRLGHKMKCEDLIMQGLAFYFMHLELYTDPIDFIEDLRVRAEALISGERPITVSLPSGMVEFIEEFIALYADDDVTPSTIIYDALKDYLDHGGFRKYRGGDGDG